MNKSLNNPMSQQQNARADILANIQLKQLAGRKPTLLNFGDSLVRGSSGGCYLTTLTPALESRVGMGGGGFYSDFSDVARDLEVSGDGANWFVNNVFNYATAGWSEQLSSVDVTGNGKYGFSGMGIFKNSASGQKIYYRQARRPFTRVTLFYLEKSGGGSFDFGKPGNVVSVNCSGASPVMRSVSRRIWTNTPEDNVVEVSNTSGDVYLYGIMLENDSIGGTVTSGGRGGEKAETFAKLDASSWINYISIINPAAVFLNLGTNDTTISSAYKTDMLTLINRVHASDGGSVIPIVLTLAHTGRTATLYRQVIMELANENQHVYVFDWRDVVGEFPYIYDSIHLNANGCALIGAAYLDLCGGPSLTGAAGQWPWSAAAFIMDNLVSSPDRNSRFTAAATDWVATGAGATINYVQGVGVQTTAGSAFTGAALGSPYFGGDIASGSLVCIRARCSAIVSPPILYPYGEFSGRYMWPLGSQITEGGKDFIWIYRLTAPLTGLRLHAPAAAGTFTISLFEVRILP